MITFEGREVIVKDTKGFSSTSRIRVDSYGRVEIVKGIFSGMSEEDMQMWVDDSARFLRRKLNRLARVSLPDFSDGAKLTFMGLELTVRHEPGKKCVDIEGDTLIMSKESIGPYMWMFLEHEFLPYVHALTARYSKEYDLPFSSVRLSDPLTLWGSYNSKRRSIIYNYSLAFLPEEFIRYLIVHELCHSVHGGHGADFWATVERIMPGAKKLDKRLNVEYDIEWTLERAGICKPV